MMRYELAFENRKGEGRGRGSKRTGRYDRLKIHIYIKGTVVGFNIPPKITAREKGGNK